MNIPPSFNFSGNKDRALELRSEASSFNSFIMMQVELGGVPFLHREKILNDGSVISVTTRKGEYDLRTSVINIFGSGIPAIIPIPVFITVMTTTGVITPSLFPSLTSAPFQPNEQRSLYLSKEPLEKKLHYAGGPSNVDTYTSNHIPLVIGGYWADVDFTRAISFTNYPINYTSTVYYKGYFGSIPFRSLSPPIDIGLYGRPLQLCSISAIYPINNKKIVICFSSAADTIAKHHHVSVYNYVLNFDKTIAFTLVSTLDLPLDIDNVTNPISNFNSSGRELVTWGNTNNQPVYFDSLYLYTFSSDYSTVSKTRITIPYESKFIQYSEFQGRDLIISYLTGTTTTLSLKLCKYRNGSFKPIQINTQATNPSTGHFSFFYHIDTINNIYVVCGFNTNYTFDFVTLITKSGSRDIKAIGFIPDGMQGIGYEYIQRYRYSGATNKNVTMLTSSTYDNVSGLSLLIDNNTHLIDPDTTPKDMYIGKRYPITLTYF